MNKTMSCMCEPKLTRRNALMLLATLGVSSETVFAQDVAKTEPRSYKVVFENETVRILEYTARGPGLGVCGAGKHSHPAHVTVTLTPAKVKVTNPDGSTSINNLKAGEAFFEPASTHLAENIGGSGTKMVLVEIKDKNWKPATG